jgi:hypothetical protein
VSVPTAHTCLVSFTDCENIRHSVEVVASTLYEAATLARAEFSALRIHGECARRGYSADSDDQTAEHDARGAVGQGRGLASR